MSRHETKPLEILTQNGTGQAQYIGNFDGFVVRISGTFDCEIELEVSMDSQVWHQVGAGKYTAPDLAPMRYYGAMAYIRAVVTNYSSGTPVGIVGGHNVRST